MGRARAQRSLSSSPSLPTWDKLGRMRDKRLPNQSQWLPPAIEEPMDTSLTTPNHRILIVDDNPASHKDFRKILCPDRPGKSEVQDLKAALFDKAPKTPAATDFEL